MTAFSCMKVVYEYTSLPPYTCSRKNIVVPDTQVYHSQERQQPGKRNTIIKKHSRSDLIRCIAVMKLACSVLAYK